MTIDTLFAHAQTAYDARSALDECLTAIQRTYVTDQPLDRAALEIALYDIRDELPPEKCEECGWPRYYHDDGQCPPDRNPVLYPNRAAIDSARLAEKELPR